MCWLATTARWISSPTPPARSCRGLDAAVAAAGRRQRPDAASVLKAVQAEYERSWRADAQLSFLRGSMTETSTLRSAPAPDLRGRGATMAWFFIAPALLFYSAFVLVPIGITVYYSLLRWNGIGAMQFKGIANYITVLSEPGPAADHRQCTFQLVLYFTILPVGIGLGVAQIISQAFEWSLRHHRPHDPFHSPGYPAGRCGYCLELDARLEWRRQPDAPVHRPRRRHPRLARRFSTLRCPVGFIGACLLGLCTMLLVTGIAKIDPTALRGRQKLDGASGWDEFIYVTLPGLRQEIGVCITVTVIAALASFDIVYIATGGGGQTTTVPGLEVYRLAFAHRQVGRSRLGPRHRADGAGHRLHPADPVDHAGANEPVRPSSRPVVWHVRRAGHFVVPDVRDPAAVHHHVSAALAPGTYPPGLQWPSDPQWGTLSRRSSRPISIGCCSRA